MVSLSCGCVSGVSAVEAGQMVTPSVRLVRPLGAGGMGAVWVADHLALHTQVVVKFMSEELLESPEAVARFSREAAAASQVKSPHVVQMLDHGVMQGGAPYIVMEHLDGHDLSVHLEAHGGRLPPTEVLHIMTQLARALTKAHERSIVHRDIKPPNIFLLDAGTGEAFVKLLDFGIAKTSDGLMGSTTRTGSMVGSPYYMSPEQVIGTKTIDFRSDLWSLGVVAFEALVGAKPFYAETIGGLALKIHHEPLPMPSKLDPTLPFALDAWFTRACARDVGDRFQSAKEMVEALTVAITGDVRTSGAGSSSGTRPAVTDPSALAFANTALPSGPFLSDTNAGIHSEARTGNAASLRTGSRRPLIFGASALALGAIAAVLFVSSRAPHEAAVVSDKPVENPRSPAPAPEPIPPTIEPLLLQPPTVASVASTPTSPNVTAASAGRHVRHAGSGTSGTLPAASATTSASANTTARKPRKDDPDDIK
jgi:eukaryotic-like serine/threonine-protein kinase